MPDDRIYYSADWWDDDDGDQGEVHVLVEASDADEVYFGLKGVYAGADTPGNLYLAPANARRIAEALLKAAEDAEALAAEKTHQPGSGGTTPRGEG